MFLSLLVRTRRMASDLLTLLAVLMISGAALACIAIAAHAQGVAETGSAMDASPRSSAMGGASNAVFWDQAPNPWANPALLGYQQGLLYEWRWSQLVPEFAPDIRLSSMALRMGGAGAGVAFSGKPFGIGYQQLDLGTLNQTDSGGNELGTFGAHVRVDSWGFGVSAAAALARVLRTFGNNSLALSRYGDLSFGMTFKHVELAYAPASLGGVAEASNHDIGVHARLTPTAFFEGGHTLPVRVDLAYGWSKLNAGDEEFQFVADDVSSPSMRQQRNGAAMRISIDPAGWAGGSRENGSLSSAFRKGLTPLLSMGAAADWNDLSAGGREPFLETSGRGIEITLANLLTYRMGHYEDKYGDVDGDTRGWGVALPLGHLAGIRYDWASFPQPTDADLPNLHRNALVTWLDLMAIGRAMRSRDGR